MKCIWVYIFEMSKKLKKIHHPKDLEELRALFTSSDTYVVVLYQADGCEPSSHIKELIVK